MDVTISLPDIKLRDSPLAPVVVQWREWILSIVSMRLRNMLEAKTGDPLFLQIDFLLV